MFPSHKPAVVLASILLTYVMSLMTYKYVETRFNSLRIVSKKFWVFALSVGQLISVAIFFLMFTGVSRGWNQDWALNTHQVMNRGCDAGLIDFKKCKWGDPKAKSSIYLVGDSMSWAIADSIINTSLKEGLSLQTLIRNGCPVIDLVPKIKDSCTEWRSDVISILFKDLPELVIIANDSTYPAAELSGTGELVKRLNDAKVKVLFILPPRGGDTFSGRRAIAFNPGGANRSTRLLPPIDVNYYGLLGYQNEKFFSIYNPSKFLCKQDCASAVNGADYYNYTGHLSVYANQVLEPSISKMTLGLLENQ
jgi:hypothetical protein